MPENILQKLLDENSAYFKDIIDHKNDYRVQIIYKQINRDENNLTHFN